MNDFSKMLRLVLMILRGLLLLPWTVLMTPYVLLSLLFASTAKRLGIRKTTMILSAAVECNLTKLHQGLSNGEDINAFNKEGETALHRAAWLGYTSFVRELVTLGADINLKNHSGMTAIDIAAHRNQRPVGEYLLEQGAELSPISDVVFGNVESIKTRIHEGLDVNGKVIPGSSLLHLAAKKGHLEIVQVLLDHGADVNPESSPESPLNLAAAKGHLAIAQLLVENGANLNSWPDERTPLHAAVSGENLDLVTYLIQKGADVNARSDFPLEQTPLFLAVAANQVAIAEVLLENGADAKAKLFLSPSISTVARSNPEMMDLLSKHM